MEWEEIYTGIRAMGETCWRTGGKKIAVPNVSVMCMCYKVLHMFGILLQICSTAWVLELEAFFLISTAVHIRSFISHHPAQCVSISHIIPTGHGIWSGSFPEHPPYDVPDENGNFLSPVLSGFYMFLTMIILLQVKDKASLLLSRKKVLKTDYNQ